MKKLLFFFVKEVQFSGTKATYLYGKAPVYLLRKVNEKQNKTRKSIIIYCVNELK